MIYCKYCRNKKGCVYAGEDCTREECKDNIPTTNADRIRAMTDEELAEWYLKISMCPCDAMNDGCALNDDTCRRAWLDWLRKDAG